MKQLIVNADDFGADTARNAGISEGLKAGVITSVSILANGPALTDIHKLLATLPPNRISWGLHLNFSEGRPVSSPLSILTGPDGLFQGKTAAWRILGNAGNDALDKEIRQEMHAQINALKEAGIPISHLDGHQHIHVFPAVIRAALDEAEANGIPWMRLPDEPAPLNIGVKDLILCKEAARFIMYAQAARFELSSSLVKSPLHFRGLYLKNRLTLKRLTRMTEDLPDGLTELMVHPGRIPESPCQGPFAAFATAWRTRELDALLHPRFRRSLDETEIELIPFPEESL